jgi:hypothetical protein
MYSSQVKIRMFKSRMMRLSGHVALIEKSNACGLLVGKKPLRRWMDTMRNNLREVEWGDVDWIGLAQDRNKWRALVNSELNLRVP